jgi:hypothetical protein
MPYLSRRRWFATATLLMVAAIAARLLAMHHEGRAMMAMARAAAVPTERVQRIDAGFLHARTSGQWDRAGVGLAVLAIGSWLLSRRRHEPGGKIVPFILLTFYILLLSLIV